MHAEDHGHRPDLHDRHVDRALGAMGVEGADRGRDDDRQRGADAERHARHPRARRCTREDLVEDRHDDRAAADAEDACEQAGDGPRRDQRDGEEDEVADGNSSKHDSVPTQGRLLWGISGAGASTAGRSRYAAMIRHRAPAMRCAQQDGCRGEPPRMLALHGGPHAVTARPRPIPLMICASPARRGRANARRPSRRHQDRHQAGPQRSSGRIKR